MFDQDVRSKVQEVASRFEAVRFSYDPDAYLRVLCSALELAPSAVGNSVVDLAALLSEILQMMYHSRGLSLLPDETKDRLAHFGAAAWPGDMPSQLTADVLVIMAYILPHQAARSWLEEIRRTSGNQSFREHIRFVLGRS